MPAQNPKNTNFAASRLCVASADIAASAQDGGVALAHPMTQAKETTHLPPSGRCDHPIRLPGLTLGKLLSFIFYLHSAPRCDCAVTALWLTVNISKIAPFIRQN